VIVFCLLHINNHLVVGVSQGVSVDSVETSSPERLLKNYELS